MPNPFFYGGRVEPEQFVGRRAELRRIFAGLDVAHTGQMQSFSVVGPRRIGKSSLLFYIANRYAHYMRDATPYRFAYIELQDARCHTLVGLLNEILTQLGAGERIGNASPLVAFQDAILALKARGVLPVVCLDEFEELYRHEQFTFDFYESLRFLMNQHALALIIASKTPLIDLAQTLGYTSPFFNIFTHLQLGEFTDDEARELIARGATCDRPFTPEEQRKLLALAGNHPYKLQLAGSLLYQAKADNQTVNWKMIQREFTLQIEAVGAQPATWHNLPSLRFLSSVFAFAFYVIALALLMLNRNSINEHQWTVVLAAILVLVAIVLTLISFGVIPINDFERTV